MLLGQYATCELPRIPDPTMPETASDCWTCLYDVGHVFYFITFINGHVTQEVACVMAAITMAANVTVKCHDALVTEAKWYYT